MIDIYEEKGMFRADANIVVTTMAQYKEFFDNIMIAE